MVSAMGSRPAMPGRQSAGGRPRRRKRPPQLSGSCRAVSATGLSVCAVYLKKKTGDYLGCAVATAANVQGTKAERILRCDGAVEPVTSVTLLAPCYSPGGTSNAVASRQNVAIA